MIKLNEIARMRDAERGEALDDLVRKAKGAPNLEALDAEIRSFEIRYEMSSVDMRKQMGSGELHDTAETAKWLILVKARDRVRQSARGGRYRWNR